MPLRAVPAIARDIEHVMGLKERGVLVRHFDKDPIRDYNRITIGTQEQMDIFLTKLEELL